MVFIKNVQSPFVFSYGFIVFFPGFQDIINTNISIFGNSTHFYELDYCSTFANLDLCLHLHT